MVDLVLIALTVVAIGYWIDQYVSYAMFRVSSPSSWDLLMALIAIAVMLETSRRALGPTISIIALVFLAQLYFGSWLPGRLSHPGMSVERILEFTFSTQEALFGVIAATFATFVFPFMIFGAFLERSGAGPVLHGAGHGARRALARRSRQDRGDDVRPVRLDLGLVGRQCGDHRLVHDPADEAHRVPPHDAGAIEAIASTGGQFMPPIMGAGVFILATLTQTSYLTIALMNVIPAAIFFVFLLAMVDLQAIRSELAGPAAPKRSRASSPSCGAGFTSSFRWRW